MAMIWGLKRLKGNPTPEAREMMRRAAILLADLAEAKEKIIVPAVVVTELLCGIPRDHHGEFVAELQRRFFCPPFDLRACALAAELWQQRPSSPQGPHSQRPLLKLDVMIVATAKVAGAGVFYSNDKQCRAFAALANLDARDLPTHSQNLFTEAEVNRSHGPPE